MYNSQLSHQERSIAEANFIARVYMWMSAALVFTGLVSLFTAASPAMIEFIFGNSFMRWGIMLAQIGLVFALGAAAQRISPAVMIGGFFLYAGLNGLILSVIFLVFEMGSIATTFFISAGTFAAMSVFGYVTKQDLTSLGRILMMALIGLVIASIVNFFLHSDTFGFIISFVGVLIFVGLTAYDTQKIKNIGASVDLTSPEGQKASIWGALALYLDFINLFLYMLRLFGRRK